MKLCVVSLIGVLALTSANVSGSKYGLKDDIDRVLALIPNEKINEIIKKYDALNDPEIKELQEYFKGEEAKTLVNKINRIPEVVEATARLSEKGVDIGEVLKKLAILLGVPIQSYSYNKTTKNSVADMMAEIQAAIPRNRMLSLFLELMIESEDMQQFVASVKSKKTHEVVLKILDIPEAKAAVERMRGYGMDVERMAQQIKLVLEWN